MINSWQIVYNWRRINSLPSVLLFWAIAKKYEIGIGGKYWLFERLLLLFWKEAQMNCSFLRLLLCCVIFIGCGSGSSHHSHIKWRGLQCVFASGKEENGKIIGTMRCSDSLLYSIEGHCEGFRMIAPGELQCNTPFELTRVESPTDFMWQWAGSKKFIFDRNFWL